MVSTVKHEQEQAANGIGANGKPVLTKVEDFGIKLAHQFPWAPTAAVAVGACAAAALPVVPRRAVGGCAAAASDQGGCQRQPFAERMNVKHAKSRSRWCPLGACHPLSPHSTISSFWLLCPLPPGGVLKAICVSVADPKGWSHEWSRQCSGLEGTCRAPVSEQVSP